jgi:hypothetical protein
MTQRQRGGKKGGTASTSPPDRLHGPWYVLWGARLLVGGTPIALCAGILLLSSTCNARFVQVYVPGSAAAPLDAGSYSIYYEYPAALSWFQTPEVEFRLAAADGGAAVPLFPPGGSESGTAGTRASVLLYDADVPTSGAYDLTAWYPTEQARSDVAIAVGRGPTERLLRFLGIVVFGALGIVIWMLLAILVSRYFHPPRARRPRRGASR